MWKRYEGRQDDRPGRMGRLNVLVGARHWLILAMAWLISSAGHAAGGDESTWMRRFGSHYEPVPWGQTVRDPMGAGRAGYWFMDRRTEAQQNAELAELRAYMGRGLVRNDIVLGVGGLGSGRSMAVTTAFLDGVSRDGGAEWRAALAARVQLLVPKVGSNQLVLWQFGNEINSPRFRQNVSSWAEARDAVQMTRQMGVIPIYVEYYLAPGIEAVREAQAVLGVPGEQVRVLLGSLAGALNPASRRWFSELMNYSIEGTYAPSLKGRVVADVIDGISYHYLASGPQSSWDTAREWLVKLQKTYPNLRHIWATEELGVRRAREGYGASFSLRIFARYLAFWQEAGWTSGMGRCMFWGSTIAESGESANQLLTDLTEFFGVGGDIRARSVKIADMPSVESYVLSGSHTGNKAVIIFPAQRTDMSESVRSLKISVDDLGVDPPGFARAMVRVISHDGSSATSLELDRSGDAFQLRFGKPLRYGSGDTLFVELYARSKPVR